MRHDPTRAADGCSAARCILFAPNIASGPAGEFSRATRALPRLIHLSKSAGRCRRQVIPSSTHRPHPTKPVPYLLPNSGSKVNKNPRILSSFLPNACISREDASLPPPAHSPRPPHRLASPLPALTADCHCSTSAASAGHPLLRLGPLLRFAGAGHATACRGRWDARSPDGTHERQARACPTRVPAPSAR